MAKGIVQSATDAVKTVTGTAIGAAAAAAATVVIENVARSIANKRGEPASPVPPTPAIEDAVRHLMTPPDQAREVKQRAQPKRRAAAPKKFKIAAAMKKTRVGVKAKKTTASVRRTKTTKARKHR